MLTSWWPSGAVYTFVLPRVVRRVILRQRLRDPWHQVELCVEISSRGGVGCRGMCLRVSDLACALWQVLPCWLDQENLDAMFRQQRNREKEAGPITRYRRYVRWGSLLFTPRFRRTFGLPCGRCRVLVEFSGFSVIFYSGGALTPFSGASRNAL